MEAIPESATLLGDKGYDSKAIREAAAARNVWANVPNKSDHKQRFGFSPWLYRQRNLVERFSAGSSISEASYAPDSVPRRVMGLLHGNGVNQPA